MDKLPFFMTQSVSGRTTTEFTGREFWEVLGHFVCLLLNQQDIQPSGLFTKLCISNIAFIPQPPTAFSFTLSHPTYR